MTEILEIINKELKQAVIDYESYPDTTTLVRLNTLKDIRMKVSPFEAPVSPMLAEYGMLEYKCRRCGTIASNTHTPNVLLTVLHIVNGYELPKEWFGTPVHKIDIHNCKDGGIGVADFIGGIGDSKHSG